MADKTPIYSPTELKEHQRVMRDLRQQGQAAVTWGLPNPATEAAVLGMGLVIRDRLADAAAPDRATQAAALAATMLDKTIQKMPQAPKYQCAKGCNYCCHGAVSVSAPELFRIVRLIDAGTSIDKAGVIERAKARSADSFDAVLTLRDPCPLLIEGNCSVYEDRPMGCRQFVSTNAEGCRTAFEQKNGELPFVPGAANAGLIVRSLLMGAAASLGLKADTYELSSALLIALEQPDAEARWLAGEDVLAGALKTPQPPNMQGSVQRWSQMLASLYV
jgi:Fe-S-cluster containining protein